MDFPPSREGNTGEDESYEGIGVQLSLRANHAGHDARNKRKDRTKIRGEVLSTWPEFEEICIRSTE